MKKEILNRIARKTALLCLFVAIFGVTAFAQDEKVEISGSVGYTATSGFTIDPVVLAGTTVNKIGVDSGFAYNFQGDVLFGENTAFGFMFASQKSKLSYRGTDLGVGGSSGTTTIADMTVYNYQFPFTYNFLDSDAKVRPFLFIGLGWTQFSPGVAQVGKAILGANHDLESNSQFSVAMGGGVKVFLTPKFGIKGTARWTPTYITSQSEGMWCNYYYCAVYGDLKYVNQGEFTGGLFVRF